MKDSLSLGAQQLCLSGAPQIPNAADLRGDAQASLLQAVAEAAFAAQQLH